MRRARERCSQCSTRIPPRTADLLEGSALTISSSKPSDRQSPPALLAQLDADARYTADHKQKMRAEITAAAQQQFDTAHATYRQDQLRDIGQKEGAARAAPLNNPPSLDPYAPDGERVKAHIRLAHEANTQRRIDLDLRDLDATTDLADVVDMFDEAEAHGGEIMRRVGKHAVRRATALYAAMRKANPGQQSPDAMSSPEGRLLAGMRERYAQWQKENPTPAQKLKRTLDEKANLEHRLQSPAQGGWTEVNETGRPFARFGSPPTSRSFVVGCVDAPLAEPGF